MSVLTRRRGTDMTQGSIIRHLISFAIPLILGNLFQQLYNTVDAWVVGNFVSNEAFSAVGSVGSIIYVLISFFMGLSSGAGVVISQYYGAHQYDKVHEAVHTSIALTLIAGVVITAVGLWCVPYALRLMKIPNDVFPEASAYLTVYFSGIIGLVFYNMGSGILRAIGDSTRPFYFLVTSAVINTVLDLVFVLVFHMGVKGVAYATIIAQGISAILVVITLCRSDGPVKLYIREIKLNLSILRKIVSVGLPSGLQMAITAFSNTFVQSYINSFGSDCMAGWTIYSKIDALIVIPANSFSLAASTFVGQNLGIGNVKRAKKGAATTTALTLSTTAVLILLVMIFARPVAAFFNDKPEVIKYGVSILTLVIPLHPFFGVSQIYAEVLRGAGNSRAPMIIYIVSFVVFRQIYLYVMSNYISNTVRALVFGYPLGWILACTAMLIYYFKTDLTKNRVVE